MGESTIELDVAWKLYRVTLRDAIERIEQHEHGEQASVAELPGLRVAKTLLENMRNGESLEEAEMMLRRAEEYHPGNEGFTAAATAIVELLRGYAVAAAAETQRRLEARPAVTDKACPGCGRPIRKVNRVLYCVRCGVHARTEG